MSRHFTDFSPKIAFTNCQFGRQPRSNEIPSQISRDARGRAMLRLKNVHSDLDGEDLNNLFLNIAPVDFVKFDPRDEAVAYVCFQQNNNENNTRAISKFDGKKAMGNTLVVENATSLADRIAPGPRANIRAARDAPRERSGGKEAPRANARKPKARKPRPAKKTAEDLDAELSAYMGVAAEPASAPESTGAFPAQDNGVTE